MSTIRFVLAFVLLALAANSPLSAVTMDWVTVDQTGNPPDPTTGGVYGSVAVAYRIMKFEFTFAQYAAFLNAIDPQGINPNAVYNPSMDNIGLGGIVNNGTSDGSRYVVSAGMSDKPVNWVSWFDIARVANWLHNGGQKYVSSDDSATAPQNVGAYSVGTATGSFPNRSGVPKNPDARYWLPTEDEWYKAAFYTGAGDAYTVYGNGFNDPPALISVTPTGDGSAGAVGNFANYEGGQRATTVGTNGGPNFYGAFDMSGNLWEWFDSDGTAGSLLNYRYRGGSYTFSADISSSGYGDTYPPWGEMQSLGFRLAAAVPEPSTYALALAGLVCGGYTMWRRRKQA